MTEYTAEVVKMEFASLMGALPTYFETLNTQLAEAFSIEQETMQTFVEWDMLTQMETLNTNIIDNFTLQNESFVTLFEGLKEYFTEAFTLKDELFQLSMETLTTLLTEAFAANNELLTVLMEGLTAYLAESFAANNELLTVLMEGLTAYLTEAFATNNELLMVLMEGLTAYLAEAFAIRNELSQNLANSMMEVIMMLFEVQQALTTTLFSALMTQLAVSFSTQLALLTSMLNLLLTQLILNFTMLSFISASILSGFIMLTASISVATGLIVAACNSAATEVSGVILAEMIGLITFLNSILTSTNKISDDFDDTMLKLTDETNEEYSIELAEKANELTHAGNQMTAIGLGLDIGSFLVDLFIPFADGGIPGYGELFVAREAGPEFVGSFGSRNVVMNNDQIVAAVSGGVYDAVRRANAEQTQQPIYLNVEAKVRENVLFDMMETVKAERGVRLATGGAW